jgi:hypothetical protein
VSTSVYRNLRKPGVTWSIRVNGKVTGYARHVHLKDVRSKHATAAALDRIRSGVREVSVWLVGEVVSAGDDAGSLPDVSGWRSLCCDPKRFDHVCDAATGERVDGASEVVLTAADGRCRVYYR